MTVSEFVKGDRERACPIVVIAPLENDHFFYWHTFDLVCGRGWHRIKNRRIIDIRTNWIIRTLVITGGAFTTSLDDE